jgi:hypothetical protein
VPPPAAFGIAVPGSVFSTSTSRVATAAERARLWPRVVDAYANYDEYQRRTGREIPLVILERRPS